MKLTKKQDMAVSWAVLYALLAFTAIVWVGVYAKYGGYLLCAVIFLWVNLCALHVMSYKHELIIKIIDSKASESINLLAESIKLQSRDLTSIHEWIKSVTYPKLTTKLH